MTLTIPEIERLLADATPSPFITLTFPDFETIIRLAIDQARELAAANARIAELEAEIATERLAHKQWHEAFDRLIDDLTFANHTNKAQAAEVERSREALERIGGVRGPYSYPFPEANPAYGSFAVMEARAALKEQPE